MFRNKERINILETQIGNLKLDKQNLKNRVGNLESENKRFRSDLDYEHKENYIQHQKLKEIDKILDEQDYGNITNLKARIKTIINKNELVKNEQD